MVNGMEYRELFKKLVKAYYEDVFEETIEEIFSNSKVSKESFAKVISALCGVEVDYSNKFSIDLVRAIENYRESNRVVINTHSCVKNCIQIDGKTICQNACPFDAILIGKDKADIDINMDTCVNCGICVDTCDNKNFIDKIEFMPLIEDLRKEKRIIAAVAPAIVGQFGEDVSMGQIRAGLKRIGFVDMVEVAFFADMLTIKEAVEFNRLIVEKEDFMLSSCCCPIWVGMIKAKFHELIKYTSPSISPMIASGKVIKALDPECKVVFVGPCIAKKAEAKMEDLKGAIDYVLTFDELEDIFDVFDIKLEGLHEVLSTQYSSKSGRIYGRIGGVSTAVKDALREMFPDKLNIFSSEQASGIKECKEMLKNALEGNTKAKFLEGMGCDGGCVGGPKAIISKEKGKEMVDRFGDESKVHISTNNRIMSDFLLALGIKGLEDFKNKEKVKIFERDF
ncbi:[Fe-Fe] hydrogenase large subunit C-terminal domain-containing protein [Clostridium sp. Cult3]|uniref:[Fe-Fe] hydrogenase large subunit C-terminal domain-containing protein n=1 Tax=Clostridium sp. Cult3 TaxID=2079004 RepID=UPI001F163839|nr:[Fe-Fe] hydrogenase large subunit C-terminal domain-containing protein [Clostridium sp. Cult3]MCF6460204.1 iron hydrogenase [Clostridium sp. Cult3]